MKQNSKIQAFTLTEITIALLIAAIVIGIAFSVLNMVQKQIMIIQDNYKNSTQINTIETALWIDFSQYNRIEYDVVEEELKFSSAIDSTNYILKREYIIKELDTFLVPIGNKTFFFNGKEVEKGKVDALKLEFSEVLLKQKLFIYKKNDASIFMN